MWNVLRVFHEVVNIYFQLRLYVYKVSFRQTGDTVQYHNSAC